MQTRQIPDSLRGSAGSSRTRDAIVATDNPVDVYDGVTRQIIREVLLIDGVEWRDPAPLLLDHDRAMPTMAGSVTNFRREPGRLVATLRWATGTQAAEESFNLVAGGHAKSVSVGYKILEATDIRPEETATVRGRSYTAGDTTLRVVTRWQLREVSLVPIGADEAAQIRSDVSDPRSNTRMLSTIQSRDLAQLTFVDVAASHLRGRGREVPQDPFETCRAAYMTVDGLDAIGDLLKTWLLDGWQAYEDSLLGIVRTVSAPNYLAQELLAVSAHPRMEKLVRRQPAPAISYGISATTYRLMKFALAFKIDEMDMVGNDSLDLYQTSLFESMRAARALVSDLQWSVILENPDAADGSSLFSTNRGNLVTEAMGDTGLANAIAAIASQTGTDDRTLPVHWNLAPKYLLTSPQQCTAARKLVRQIALNDGRDIVVRSESRMGTTGVLDPRDNATLQTGNATNWMLAAPGEQKASLVLALLNGQTEPTIRVRELEQGEWGFAVDVSFSCACAAVAGEPLYWSTGAGE